MLWDVTAQDRFHYLSFPKCFEISISAQTAAGAIRVGLNVILDIKETTFVVNEALSGDGGAIATQQNVTLTVRETTFIGNEASGVGGAIAVNTTSYLTTINCLFDNNTSQYIGCAIIGYFKVILDIQHTNFTSNRGYQSKTIDVTQHGYLHVTDCTFKDNHVEQIGGAVVGTMDAVLEIQNTNFTHNSASQEGAINVQQQVNISLTNCRLDHIFASDSGGAIYAMVNVTLERQETNFTGNSTFHDGGALYISQAGCQIVRSVFHGNSAKTTRGAVHIDSKSSLKIENTHFTNNNSSDGGAICVKSSSNMQAKMCSFRENFTKQSGWAIKLKDYSTSVIESCCFLANHADNHPAGYGGCLDIVSVTLTFNNSQISENIGQTDGAGVTGLNSRIQVGFLF